MRHLNPHTLGIMQPYFLPYIGYFQLIAKCDAFVIYDNIQYSKKSWVNRNRFLQNGAPALFSLPLRRDSDFLDVCARFIADDFAPEKLLDKIHFAYRRAPHHAALMGLLGAIFYYPRKNLFDFTYHSILCILRYLGVQTPLLVSSAIEINHALRAQDKVIAIAKNLGAKTYLNAIGGVELYENAAFECENIALRFIKTSESLAYAQFGAPFVANLSIIDCIAFNDQDSLARLLGACEIIKWGGGHYKVD